MDTSHLACTIFSAPDFHYYLQLSGSFFVGKKAYYLDAAYDISSIYEARTRQQDLYQQIFVILIVACACLSYILAFFLTRPLARLSKASREIASGNYDFRSKVKSNDEVGAVSRDFDLMADHLQKSIEDLQESMERQNLFIGNFTHELKTPMTSIIGYADLLRSQSLSKEDEIDAAKYIFSEGKRLEHLSLKLLDIFVSKNESFTLAKASPADITTSLVNHLKPVLAGEHITLTCEISLTPLPNGHSIDSRCYPSLTTMMNDCRKAGLQPLICSSYRSQEKQESLFQERIDELRAQGYSKKDAKAKAATSVARPGTSEHQLGLAVDIVDKSHQTLDAAQEDTPVQQWLLENSWKYGFILRYPNQKSNLTGIIYEPWHYRYVGQAAAQEIHERGICLEEYLEELS